MLPELKVLKLFGPKTKYPAGGEHKLLVWYEHNEDGESHFPREILFWFQGVKRDKVPSDFVEITKVWERGRKQRQKNNAREFDNEKRSRELKELKTFEAVLAGKDPRTVL